MSANTMNIPKDGWEGFKENWNGDAISGFLVFLLALPLSLGIAKASEFPPVMGVLTAIIGGVVISFIAGSRLTIKGPAAGLIVIVANAVHDFGGGELGWKLALGTIVVAGVVQILFGVLKLGSLSDFFPSSVVHGMLAAIGLIIFSKQIHAALGIDPKTLADLEPLELIARIPHSIATFNPYISLVGVISLVIIFGLPMIKNKYVKMIPSPLIVLAVTIPLGLYFDFKNTQPAYALVIIGNFIDSLGVNVSFEAIAQMGVFLKYVIMFALVGTIESLLTVKAIDAMDPYRRKSNYNKDLIAVGIGNCLAGILGGLPMISEVARSSANVNNGAKTRWANFFHGIFLLISVLLLVPVLEMIPNAALAAMLIGVGYRLAAPKEFYKTYKIGLDQLIIFTSTIIATLATDLLVGVAVGILVKFVTHLFFGVPVKSLFKANVVVNKIDDDNYEMKVREAAIFSNYLIIKKYFAKIPPNAILTIDFTDAMVVDHTFMDHLNTLESIMHSNGGNLVIKGIEKHKHLSTHPLAARRIVKGHNGMADFSKQETLLTPRQSLLQKYAEAHDCKFSPRYMLTPLKFKTFGFAGIHKIKAEENLIKGKLNGYDFELSDITIEEVQRLTKYDYKMTVLMLDKGNFNLPDFSIEAEGIFDKMMGRKDINFDHAIQFSNKYLLFGPNEQAIRNFFNQHIIQFFEAHPGFYLNVVNKKLFIYKEPAVLSIEECDKMLVFATDFIRLISNVTAE